MAIAKDKIYHLAAGAIASAVVFCVTGNPWCGFAAAVIAGAAKEYWDSRGHGCVELMDFVTTAAGGAVACGLLRFFCR